MRNIVCHVGNKVMAAGCCHCSWLENGLGSVLGERQVMGWRRRRIPWRESSRAAQDCGAEPSLEVRPKKS